MKKEEIYKAWIRKARSDLSVAENELKTETPEYNVICFLLQQFSEKYLKGFLVFSETPFKKSHSIEYLLSLCKQINLDFNQFYNEEFVRKLCCNFSWLIFCRFIFLVAFLVGITFKYARYCLYSFGSGYAKLGNTLIL